MSKNITTFPFFTEPAYKEFAEMLNEAERLVLYDYPEFKRDTEKRMIEAEEEGFEARAISLDPRKYREYCASNELDFNRKNLASYALKISTLGA